MISGWVIWLGELLIVSLIGTMIGAFLLKTSCALCNLLVGARARSAAPPVPSTSQGVPRWGITTEPRAVLTLRDDETPLSNVEIPPCVPKPSFEWAMCIVFAAAVVNALAYLILVRVLRLAGMAGGYGALSSLPMQSIFYPLSFLIHSGMYAAMLPTSFGKGLLICLIYLFLGTLIAAMLVVIFFIAVALNLGVHRLGLWS